ncbi:MAG: hypothetical protein QM723_12975 [Myxococcaceae bacterium]
MIGSIGDWELRVFEGRFQQYFLPRGFGHLQLWFAQPGISVLTPSRLTDWQYEVFTAAEWKARFPTHALAARAIFATHGVRLPSRHDVASAEHCFVAALRLSHAARLMS